MMRIWSEERARQSATLHAQTLRDLGGAQTIVRDHLEVVLDDLAPPDKALAAAAFQYLVTPSGTKIAHKPSDLATWARVDEAAMRRLLQFLSSGDRRILRYVPPPLDDEGESRYEIFHDVLADAVLGWRQRYDAEQQRVEAEQRRRETEEELVRERRRLRRSRAFSVTLAVVVLICIVAVILAIQNERLATQKQNMAESARLLSMDPQAAAAAALKALQTGGGAEAEEALRAALSRPRPAMTLVPGTDSGAAQWVEMSPGEDLIAAACNDGTARLWDARSGEEQHVLEAGKASGTSATQVRFSKDGSLVITSSDDGRARVFDTGDGSLLQELGSYAHPVVAIPGAVGRRNVVLTWASTENPAVWEASTGKMLATLPAPVQVAALSADGTRVLLGAADGRLRVWTWSNGHVVVDPGAYNGFFDVGFSARDPKRVLALDRGTGDLIRWDGTSESRSQVLAKNQFRDEPRTITQPPSAENSRPEVTATDVVGVTAGKEVHILNSVTGGIWQVLPDGDESVRKLAFSPDGRYVARGDTDGTIRVFSVQIGRDRSPALWVLLGHTAAVQSLAFSHDGTTLMSAAADGSVRVWRLPTRLVALTTSQPVSDARFSVDGQTIVMGDSHAVSRSLPGNRSRFFPWRGGGAGRGTEQLRSLALSPDSSNVVAVTSQSAIPRVFALPSEKEKIIPFKAQTTWLLTRVDYSPDPTRPWIVVGNQGGGVEMLDVTTGDLRWPRHIGDSVSDVRFSSDGSMVAAASLDGTVKLFDAVSGQELRNIHHSTPVTTVAFTTDGAYLATYAEDRRIRIWSTHTSGSQPVTDVAVLVRANSLAFSPDSRFLAAARSDGTTMVYEWQNKLKPLATLHEHTGSVNTVAFDPKQPAEGPPRLMSAGDDGTVARYSCDLCEIGDDQLQRYAREQIGSR
jgi:WD40 repeat protein